MLMRKLFVALGPLLLCLLLCLLFRWMDALLVLSGFWQYALKGAALGAGIALLLPVAGITVKNNGLTVFLFVAAGLLALLLLWQGLETAGKLHWPALLAVIGVSGQAVLLESTFVSYLALTAAFHLRKR